MLPAPRSVWSKDERCLFLCERREWACKTSEVLNEHLDHTNGAKEGLHFGEVFAQTPVDDFVDSQRVRDAAIQGANVPYNGNLLRTQ